MPKFPKEFFIVREGEEPNDAWWTPNESIDTCAVLGEKVKVGIYKLVEVREVTTTINQRKK